jgi:hypothetical protein
MKIMKKMTIVLSLLACVLLSSTCEKDKDKHDLIEFKNNSNYNLFVCADWWYPDTAINFSNPALSGDFYKVAANTSDDPLRLRDTYEGRFEQHEKIMVFVFDAQVLETTPWDTVKANYLVLKRYDLSLDDLNRMNWTITYP